MAELAHNERMVSRRRGTAEEALTSIPAAKMSDQPPASRSCYYCVRCVASVWPKRDKWREESHALIRLLLAVGALAVSALGTSRLLPPAFAQDAKPGVERLYILNCGEGVAGDISRWSPGVNVGKSMDFVDSCYLIKHREGWLLWDTGLADAIAAMPEGQRPADPRATHWRRPKTLVSQLDQLGLKPSDIKYVAVSHTHPDHVGNMPLFPQATAAGAEGRIRMAIAERSALQAGSTRDQARRRP